MSDRLNLRAVKASVALSLLIASPAAAQCRGEYCTNVLVTLIYVDGASSNWVSTSGTETSLGCTPNSGPLLKVDPTRSKSDWLYSSLPSAFYLKQPVTIRTSTSGACEVSYVLAGEM